MLSNRQASALSLKVLRNKSQDELDAMNFSDFLNTYDSDTLEKLYPLQIGAGNYDPPASHLILGRNIREWRQMSASEQSSTIQQLNTITQQQRQHQMEQERQHLHQLVSQQHQEYRRQQQQERSAPQVAEISPVPTTSRRTRSMAAAETAETNAAAISGGSKLRSGHSFRTEANVDESPSPSVSKKLKTDDTNNADTGTNTTNFWPSPAAESPLVAESPPSRPTTNLKEPPPTVKADGSLFDEDTDSNVVRGYSTCHGITQGVIDSSRCEEKEDISKGFNHLVGNSVRYMGSVLSQTGEWNYDAGVIGFIMDPNFENTTDWLWKCFQRGPNQFEFHRRDCDNTTTADKKKCCPECWEHRHSFYRMCKAERELYMKEFDGKDSTTGLHLKNLRFKSPSIVAERMEHMGQRIKVLKQSEYNLKSLIKMMEKDEVEVPNMDAEYVFDPDEIKRLYADLLAKGEITRDEITDYLFQECMAVRERIKAQGSAKGHRYSGLMIQFACMLRSKTSASMYDFFRRAFNLPPNQTLCQYSNTDSTSPDGPMVHTIIQIADILDGLEIPLGDWERKVNLGWDSHVIKDSLAFCPHTKRLVGYASDAFSPDVIKDEFKRRFKEADAEVTAEEAAAEAAAAEENTANTNINESNQLLLGKHYMVFMAQTWESKSRPLNFVVGRYCLSSLSGKWIRETKRELTAVLAFYGITVNGNSFDGASENRSAMNQDLTMSLRDILPEFLDTAVTSQSNIWVQPGPTSVVSNSASDTTNNEDGLLEGWTCNTCRQVVFDTDDEAEHFCVCDKDFHSEADRWIGDANVDELNRGIANPKPKKLYSVSDLPWDMKVAYPHPTLDGTIIVALADMPHAVKKQVNAIENSGKPNDKFKRDLHLNGLPIQLRMGYDAWKTTSDYTNEGDIAIYPRLGVDVYEKTAKSRMRFGLAARSLGGSMIRCIERHQNEVEKASPSTYDSYLLVARQTDKFIDVMNGNRDKGCSIIDSANHDHVYDLLDYIKFLTHWRAQAVAANNPYLYFTPETHQDTCWTALGIVILARKQLPHGKTLVQKRGGTDNLERCFGESRGKNSGANAQGTDGQISHVSSNMLQQLGGSKKANTGKSTTFLANEIDVVGKTKKRRITDVARN